MADVILTNPTAYIIKGYRIPVFTLSDELPYAIIFKKNNTEYEIMRSSSPITIGTNNNGDYVLKTGSQHQFCYYNIKTDKNWRDGSLYNFASSYYMTNYQNPIWSTNKVVYPNGTVFIEASDAPSAIYEGETKSISESDFDLYSWTVGLIFGLTDGLCLIDNSVFEDDDSYTEDENEEDSNLWETLFEGEVTTGTEPNVRGYTCSLKSIPFIKKDSGIRVTINEVSSIATAKYKNDSTTWTVTGNLYLWSEDELVDNGLDWNLSTVAGFLPTLPASLVTLCLRNSGTYQVKIERALFEPVAYLYNGFRLPKLPEWDKSVYPYATISKYDITYELVLRKAFNYDYSRGLMLGDAIIFDITPSAQTDWKLIGEIANFVNTISFSNWSNFDIINEDGTVFLAASDPIPVYE